MTTGHGDIGQMQEPNQGDYQNAEGSNVTPLVFGESASAVSRPEMVSGDSEPVVLETQMAADTEALERPPVSDETRRPRIALMGEFSAGKSTLSNLLSGKTALPVNVTATQLPPIWMSYGTAAPYSVSVEGEEQDVDPSLSNVSVAGTSHVRLFHESKILQHADLIDMPGISDPNMAADVWQRVIHHADIVVWCSHATQAWRQSEAAVWSTMPKELYEKSILLLTRMDRILSEKDRRRVVKRVEKETEGLFRAVLPVSLLQALENERGSEPWLESGAQEMISTLAALVREVASGAPAETAPRRPMALESENQASQVQEEARPQPQRVVMPTRVRPRFSSR